MTSPKHDNDNATLGCKTEPGSRPAAAEDVGLNLQPPPTVSPWGICFVKPKAMVIRREPAESVAYRRWTSDNAEWVAGRKPSPRWQADPTDGQADAGPALVEHLDTAGAGKKEGSNSSGEASSEDAAGDGGSEIPGLVAPEDESDDEFFGGDED